ncbi:hypothetical protein DFH09DRAFT_849724, partial [Mycena vulgaris]
FFTEKDGFIESNISTYILHFSSRAAVGNPSFLPSSSLFLAVYDPHPPPEHPYIRASSSSSAVVQLYARSQQLPTAFTTFRRSFNNLPWCRAGSTTLETVHHVFVECPLF